METYKMTSYVTLIDSDGIMVMLQLYSFSWVHVGTP